MGDLWHRAYPLDRLGQQPRRIVVVRVDLALQIVPWAHQVRESWSSK